MTANQFVANGADTVVKGKTALFFTDLAIKHHLKQQISQFIGQFIDSATLDGVSHFIGFFQCVRHYALIGLRLVPGTAALRVT